MSRVPVVRASAHGGTQGAVARCARGRMSWLVRTAGVLAALACAAAANAASSPRPASAFDPAALDRIFEEFRLEAHVPGLVYGVVVDGRLVHVAGLGVRDLESNRPVDADTLFRIASMSKAFTALTVLKLRDDGRVRLDALAEEYVPELRGWTYPTADAPRIRVRDLLHHVAGFVTDDPWGDRQSPLPEAEFTRLLRDGVPFTRAPQLGYEYSNLGYALLGRVVANASRAPYADTIGRTLLQPLGMTSSGYVYDAVKPERRALGYRWEDGGWRREPDLAHGAFGAMGGLQTSANDYAKWVAYLLSAWPARDDPDRGPVRRATVREIAQGSNFPRSRLRPARSGTSQCTQSLVYGMGFHAALDCELGLALFHGGGYPGYGSHVVLLPERGVGVFVLTNRTYAPAATPVWDALVALRDAGALPPPRGSAPSDALTRAYAAAGRIYAAGDVAAGGDVLAMNVLLDRDAAGRARDLVALKAQVGECDASAPLAATGALSGSFTWTCERGRVKGSVLLAPTAPPRIQDLKLEAIAR